MSGDNWIPEGIFPRSARQQAELLLADKKAGSFVEQMARN